MIAARLLSQAEYAATFAAPMRDVTTDAEGLVDIWSYVDAIDPCDNLVPGEVDLVYRDAQSRFDHVLIATSSDTTYLAIIVDLNTAEVFGHHVLDIKRVYSL